jgi:DNA-binding CsgD family transcriptional regulator
MGQNPSIGENQDKTTVRSSINRLSENIKVTPAAGTPVSGSGTPDQLVKWTGVDGSNSYSLGNSLITEDKFGKVGIGTTAPTSKLPVQGMIEIREIRLLKLFVKGHNYKTAAKELSVTVHTISFHLRSIYEKLQVHSKSAAVAKALENRLV